MREQVLTDQLWELVGKPWRRPRRPYADRGYDHDKYRRLSTKPSPAWPAP